jgi:hypothetical protein
MFELSGGGAVGARWEKVLAEREGVGESVTQRPIYPKLTVLKKAVKSEIDVARRMSLDVLDE